MRLRRNSAVAFLLAALTLSTVAMFWTGQPESASVANSPKTERTPG